MTMKILLFSRDKFPPFRVDVSELLGKEMIRIGNSIDFVLQSDEPCSKRKIEYWNGLKVFVGSKPKNKNTVGKIFKYALDLFNDLTTFFTVKKSNYNYMIVKDKCFFGFILVLLSKIVNISIIFWLSFPIPEANIYKGKLNNSRYPKFYVLRGLLFKILLYNYVIPSCELAIMQSDQMVRDVIDQGIDRKQLFAVPMGIPNELIKLGRNKNKKITIHNKIVLYLGAMDRIRRIDFVIHCFNIVIENHPDAILFLIGDSSDKRDLCRLKRIVHDLKIQNSVKFTGFLPREIALSHVMKASVCLSPYYPTPILNSTSPTKLLEYMALNRAVVANDHPEQKKILAESRAGLCVKWEKRAFADAISYLLSNPNVALSMGEKGRDYVFKNRRYEIIAKTLDRKINKLSTMR